MAAGVPHANEAHEQERRHMADEPAVGEGAPFGRDVPADAKPRQPKFSAVVRREVRRLLVDDNWRGALEVAEDWGVVFGAAYVSKALARWVLAVAAPSLREQADPRAYAAFVARVALAVAAAVVAYLCAVVVIGGRQRALADVLHQASHGALARTGWWNFALGTVFSGYTVLQSFTVYHASHVLKHHPYLGNPAKDPDYQGLIENELCGARRSSARTVEYLWGLLSPANSLSYLRYLARNRICDAGEDPRETAARVLFFALLALTVTFAGAWGDVVLFWLVPFVTSNVWIGSLLELLEHFPMVDDPRTPFAELLLTRNRVAGPAANFVLGVHWEGYHLVHHLFPKVPSWHYRHVHELLREHAEYRKLDHGELGFRHMLRVMVDAADE